MFFSIYAVGEWLWFPTFLMIKSPRVKIKHLQLALLYFLHLQTILPNLAWFFSEYVNIIESCIVWFSGFPCGMNLSINCSPWKNPAKFHLKKFWNVFLSIFSIIPGNFGKLLFPLLWLMCLTFGIFQEFAPQRHLVAKILREKILHRGWVISRIQRSDINFTGIPGRRFMIMRIPLSNYPTIFCYDVSLALFVFLATSPSFKIIFWIWRVFRWSTRIGKSWVIHKDNWIYASCPNNFKFSRNWSLQKICKQDWLKIQSFFFFL